jgi:hypothetical protein
MTRGGEAFVAGLIVGVAGTGLGGLAYYLARSKLRATPAGEKPKDPAATSALNDARNPTFDSPSAFQE